MKIFKQSFLLSLATLSFRALGQQPGDGGPGGIPTAKLVTHTEIIKTIEKVNDYWQNAHPDPGNAFWNRAAYHTGNMAAYQTTHNPEYLKYSINWAEKNGWQGAKSNDTLKWKHTYGEGDDFVLFGDWQCCFQTYADLNQIQKDNHRIARARGVMEYEMSTRENAYWWWADGLYMVMPVMTKLYKTTGNALYLTKLHEYFTYAKQLMYDQQTGLFYRDGHYVYPAHQTVNGLKDFWARGNGWVFAALARVLSDLPENDPNRQEYIQIYRGMAKALRATQQPEGYWTQSILDTKQAPGYETSGTAFFAYGFLWGINNGLLDRKTYTETAQKSWNYLAQIALQPDGKIGYVQPIGASADKTKVVNAETTADFGVGGFLLAASEMAKFVEH